MTVGEAGASIQTGASDTGKLLSQVGLGFTSESY